MQAGFAKADITPATGVFLGGGSAGDRPSTGVLDPIHLRVLWVHDRGRDAVIVTLDWCFIGRAESDQLKGVLSREFGLAAQDILFSASHSHASPAVGTYLDLEYLVPPRDYLREVETALIKAVLSARSTRVPVTVKTAVGQTRIPLNRRQKREDGRYYNAPNPEGYTYDRLPLVIFEGQSGKPVCLLFSISTHPVAVRGSQFSADYPGLAMTSLDAMFGASCTMFVQGVAGDSRPRNLGQSLDQGAGENPGDGLRDWRWNSKWEDARVTADQLVKDVLATLELPMRIASPKIRTALFETHWPLKPLLPRADYEAIASRPPSEAYRTNAYPKWAQRVLRLIDRGTVPTHMPILFQAFTFADGVRLIALEGEPVAPFGKQIESHFPAGSTTFPAGYSNGDGMYLPTTPMIGQGGYEVDSFWEYNVPTGLAPGVEDVVDQAILKLKAAGIE